MSKPKNREIIRILLGIFPMVAGVLGACLVIKHQYDMCANSWLNNLDGFGHKYASVWDCFVSRSKAHIIIGLSLGSATFGVGWYIYRHL